MASTSDVILALDNTTTTTTVDVWDLQGHRYPIEISGLPAGNWSSSRYETSRFLTAAVQLDAYSGTTQRELRVVDLATGTVLAGRSLGANENLMPSPGKDTIFYTGQFGTSNNTTTLTVKSYGFGLDATDSSLATASATTSYTLPGSSIANGQVQDFFPPANGASGYVITNEWNQATFQQTWHAYALNGSGVGTEISLPHADADWIGTFVSGGSLWVSSYMAGAQGQASHSTYDKLGAAGWIQVDESDFWDAQDQANQPSSVARSGPYALDLLTLVPDGATVWTDDGRVESLGDGKTLVRTEVGPVGDDLGYEQWLVFDTSSGSVNVTANKAFSSNVGIVMRSVDDPLNADIYFQQINITVAAGQIASAQGDPALTLYKVALADVEAVLQGAASLDTLAGTGGSVQQVASFSAAQLTGGATPAVGQVLHLNGYVPAGTLASSLSGNGFAVVLSRIDTPNGGDASKSFVAGIPGAGGGQAWTTTLAQGDDDDFQVDPALGILLATDSDANGNRHAYKLDPANGNLSEITWSAYQAWLDGQAPQGTAVVEGTSGADRLVSPSDAAAALITGGDGNDTIVGGAGTDVIGAGLGADRIAYTDPSHLQGDFIDDGLEQATRDALRLAPGADLANKVFDLGQASSIQHIDRIDFGTDVAGIAVILSGTVVQTSDYNQNGTLGDIGVAARIGTDGTADMQNGVRVDGTSLWNQSLVFEGQGYTLDNGLTWLAGFKGNDTVTGGSGNDILRGGAGDDSLRGNLGNDMFYGGVGSDTIAGGEQRNVLWSAGLPADYDRLEYNGTTGISVDLNNRTVTVTGESGVDSYSGIEEIDGAFNAHDVVTGRTSESATAGDGVGMNLLLRGGSDTVDITPYGVQQPWADGAYVLYSWSLTPISVSYTSDNTASVSYGANGSQLAGTDSLSNVGFIGSTAYNDTFDLRDQVTNHFGFVTNQLAGNSWNMLFLGYGGSDTVLGNGQTYLHFGAVNQSSNGLGLAIDLTTGSANLSNLSNNGAALGTLTFSGANGVLGTNFADTMVGGVNDDFELFRGSAGDDFIDGRGGYDRADYRNATEGITVNLALGTAGSASQGSDTLRSIEESRGSAYDDVFDARGFVGGSTSTTANVGSYWSGLNAFQADGGNDTIYGNGATRLNYGGSMVGVRVDLAAGMSDARLDADKNTDGYKSLGHDIFSGVAEVVGSALDDELLGGGAGRTSTGLPVEIFTGGAGNDTIDGRSGYDIVSYVGSPNAIVVDLSKGSGQVQDGWGFTDSLVSIEEVTGSQYADSMLGGSTDDTFGGRRGADTIDGGGGYNEVNYSGEVAGVTVRLGGWVGASGGLPAGFQGSGLDAWGEVDVFKNIGGVEGTNHNDLIVGDAGDNRLDGRGGNDTLDGGDGNDWAEYNQAMVGVHVDLVQGKAFDDGQGIGDAPQDAALEQDTLTSIENVLGGHGNDWLVGNAVANVLDGGASNDTLEGAGGNDTLTGGAGIDTAVFAGNASDYTIAVDPITHVITVTDNVAGRDGLNTLSSIEALRFANSIVPAWVSVNPSGTYLATAATDPASAPTTLTLADLGIRPGDMISLSRTGAYQAGANGFTDTSNSMLAVFTGPAGFVAPAVFLGFGSQRQATTQVATDIAQDFNVVGPGLTTVKVPEGATGIAFSPNDSYFSDNLDPNGDYGVSVSRLDGNASYAAADMIFGTTGDDNLSGGGGNDTLRGGAGNDTLDGGEQRNVIWSAGLPGDYDRLEYNGTAGISVDLSNRTVTVTGESGVDSYSGVEEIDGAFNAHDEVTGRTSDSATAGDGAGISLLLRGGSDTVDITPYGVQQPWSDGATVYYNWSVTAISVTFTSGSTASVSYGDGANGSQVAGTDTLNNVAYFGGTAYDDTFDLRNLVTNQLGHVTNQLAGNSYNILFLGYGGNDKVLGNGQTYMHLGALNQTSNGLGLNIDLTIGSADLSNLSNNGVKMGTLTFSGSNGIFGTIFADTMVGGVNDDFEFFRGGAGDDFIDGRSGYDRADYRNSSEGVTINLAPGTASSVSQGTDTLRSIEEIRGSAYDDVFDARGFVGVGTSNTPNVGSYWTGINAFYADGGDDTIYGNGATRLNYGNSMVGVRVDMAAGVADARLEADKTSDLYKTLGHDTFSGVAEVVGSSLDDELYGGGAGRTTTGVPVEVFTGGAGNDLIDGRDGFDVAVYTGSIAGIVVDLGKASVQVQDGWGFTDTLVSIEEVVGSHYADSMLGGSEDDSFAGRRGADNLDGAGGYDEVDYGGDLAGVTVRLGGWVGASGALPDGYQGSALDGWGDIDRLRSIEGVEGSNYDDLIVGDASNNRLDGRGGNDVLDGGDGNDWAEYNQALVGVHVDLAQGKALDDGQGIGDAPQDAAVEQDTLRNIENVQGGFGDDWLVGNAVANVLDGGAGNDSLDGGADIDQAVYSGARANYTVTTIAGGYTVTDNVGGDGTDTLVSIERLVFSDTTLSLAPTPVLANDTGASASDGITRDGTVEVSGLAAGGAWQFSTDAGASWATGSGTSFTLAAGSYAADAVQVRLSDVGGSPGEASSIAPAVTVDTTGPAAPGLVSSGGATPVAVGGSTLLTISFDSPVAGFEASDLVDSKGGSFSGLASADGGTTWTLSFTPNPGKLGPASVAVNGAYTDLAGNAGQASAALAIGYFADATATDGYLRGASIHLDVDDSGTITVGDLVLGQTGADGSMAVALTAGQDAHTLLVTGGTDIATNQAFTGLLKAPAGSTLVSPLTTLLTELIDASGGSLAAAQTQLLAALSLPAGVDLTRFDPLAVAVSQGATGQALADALAVQSQTVAVANLLSAGAAALQGAAASGGGVSADVAGTAVLSALVNQIAGSTGAVDLSDAPTLAGLLNSAATDPGVLAAGLDAAKQTAAVAAASGTLAATNQAITQANSEAASAPTSQEFLSSLSKAVAVQVVAQGQITDQLAAGNTTGLPSDDRSLSALATQVDLNGLSLTSTQPVIADETAARIVDIAADPGAAAGTVVYRVQLSEGADLSAGAPTLTLAKPTGGTLTLQFNASLSTSTSLAFSAAAPTDVEGTVAYQSADFGGVTLTDFSGNITASITLPSDLTAKTQTVAIHDTTPPASPTPALLNDNGTSASDGITSDGRVSVTGLEAGASWQFSIDGGQHWANGSGSSFTLAAGSYPAHTVLVRQTDAAGNLSQADGQLASGVTIEAASGTLELLAYSWKAHTLLDGVIVHAGSQQGSTDAGGALVLSQIAETSLAVAASREIPAGEASATGQAVNLQDAIAILKMVVGLDVNGAGKVLSPYQAYAADFDGSGAVGLTDAIGVLKHVVGLSSPDPQWLFFDESDPSVPGAARLSPGTPPSISASLAGADPVHLGLVGVLRGDVDGSYAGAAGAQHLDVQYFVDLVANKHLDATQFGIYPG